MLIEYGLVPAACLLFLGGGCGRRVLLRLAVREPRQHFGHQQQPLVLVDAWLVWAFSWVLAVVPTGVGATLMGSSVEVLSELVVVSASGSDSVSLSPSDSPGCPVG